MTPTRALAADAATQLAELGLTLARTRRGLRWKVGYLATRAGLGPRAVAHFEAGEGGQLSLEALIKVAAAMDLELKLVPRTHAADVEPAPDPGKRKATALSVPRRFRVVTRHACQPSDPTT